MNKKFIAMLCVLSLLWSSLYQSGIAAEPMHYRYDNWSRLVQVAWPNGIKQVNHYNDLEQVVSLLYQKKDAELDKLFVSLGYTYDHAGFLRMRTREEPGKHEAVEQYRYDHNANLLDYHCSGTLCPTDERGNVITHQHYQFDAMNNIKTVVSNQTTLHYLYDKVVLTRLLGYQNSNPLYGNSGPWPYDAAGSLLVDQNNDVLTYTPFGQTASVLKPDGNQINYAYDGTDRQVRVQSAGNQTLYLYYGLANLLTQQQGKTKQSLLYDEGVFGTSTDGIATLYASDLAGSVLKRIRQNQVVGSFAYSPYGMETAFENEKPQDVITQHIGFDGQETDDATGLQFLGQGYRAYGANLRRFLAADGLSPFDKGGINGYVFAGNNPIMRDDPSGHSAQSILPHDAVGFLGMGLSIVGGLISGALYGASRYILATLVDIGFLALTTMMASGFNFSSINWPSVGLNVALLVVFNGVGFAGKKVPEWIRGKLRARRIALQAEGPVDIAVHDAIAGGGEEAIAAENEPVAQRLERNRFELYTRTFSRATKSAPTHPPDMPSFLQVYKNGGDDCVGVCSARFVPWMQEAIKYPDWGLEELDIWMVKMRKAGKREYGRVLGLFGSKKYREYKDALKIFYRVKSGELSSVYESLNGNLSEARRGIINT